MTNNERAAYIGYITGMLERMSDQKIKIAYEFILGFSKGEAKNAPENHDVAEKTTVQ